MNSRIAKLEEEIKRIKKAEEYIRDSVEKKFSAAEMATIFETMRLKVLPYLKQFIEPNSERINNPPSITGDFLRCLFGDDLDGHIDTLFGEDRL